MVLVFILLQVPDRSQIRPLKEKLRQLNVLGLVALLPGVICLCLALQWGGTKYAVSLDPSVHSAALPRPSRADRI